MVDLFWEGSSAVQRATGERVSGGGRWHRGTAAKEEGRGLDRTGRAVVGRGGFVKYVASSCPTEGTPCYQAADLGSLCLTGPDWALRCPGMNAYRSLGGAGKPGWPNKAKQARICA